MYTTKEIERRIKAIITEKYASKIPSVFGWKKIKELKNNPEEHTILSLVAAFDCEMDSSTIQLSKKRASCVPMRDVQVICSDGVLSFLLICLYRSRSVMYVCVNYPKKNRQQQQQTATNIDDMSYVH